MVSFLPTFFLVFREYLLSDYCVRNWGIVLLLRLNIPAVLNTELRHVSLHRFHSVGFILL